MKKYILISIIQSIIIFSCSNNSNQSNDDGIIPDSTMFTRLDTNWITDESDIIIPDKREISLKAYAFSMGLKGNVKKIEERHYSTEMKDEIMLVSTSAVNTEGYFNDGPSNHLSLMDKNQDIYFDRDGFDLKTVYYTNDSTINSISYNFYDDKGNRIKTISQNLKGKTEDSTFYAYDKDSYMPWERKWSVVESDGAVTRYFEYVTLETMKDNINGTYPFSVIARFLYIYDEKGNWISRTRLLKDCNSNSPFFPCGVARRTIYYW
jgi:hypothetical protein